jgi:N-acetylmuramoyl-L-alanine amidase
MHSSKGDWRWLCLALAAGLLLLGEALLTSQVAPGGQLSTAPEIQKQLTVYSPQTSYSLPVVTRDQVEYVGLLEFLEPLGAVSAKLEGKKWKFRFGEREGQFVAGKSVARIQKSGVQLRSPFLIENGRGLVPTQVLPQLLGEFVPGHAVAWHETSRRLFLDNAETHYTAEMKKGANGQLVITFSAPVNPSVATEPGRLRLVFRREALLPNGAAGIQNLDDKIIPSLVYSESNGNAELAVSGSVPLIANFSGDRKTITIAAVTPPAPASQSPVGATSPPANPAPAAAVAAGPAVRSLLIVIDAAHGGNDRGAAITPDMAEKDLALSWARHLQGELQAHGVASRLLRDADVSLSPEQRAVAANQAVPSLYLSVHVAGSGTGVHLFTSPTPALKAAPFLPWDSAQGVYVATSRLLAGALVTELLKRDIPALNRSSQLDPLNAIAAPALAIELAPPATGAVAQLQSGSYQLSVCTAIAGVIAELRSQLPHGGAAR